jgi:uncharacterized membrane protein YccC
VNDFCTALIDVLGGWRGMANRARLAPTMRSVVRLEASLMERARTEANRRGVTLDSLIEEGLAHVVPQHSFNQEQEARLPVALPECQAGGGIYSGVDLNDLTALLDRMGNRT